VRPNVVDGLKTRGSSLRSVALVPLHRQLAEKCPVQYEERSKYLFDIHFFDQIEHFSFTFSVFIIRYIKLATLILEGKLKWKNVLLLAVMISDGLSLFVLTHTQQHGNTLT
jgi:hypothetical protein